MGADSQSDNPKLRVLFITSTLPNDGKHFNANEKKKTDFHFTLLHVLMLKFWTNFIGCCQHCVSY